MENMRFAEAAVKEFLVFRGFTHSLHAFDAELDADVGHGFQVDRIVDLLFTVYIPRFEADNLIKLMAFLQQSLFSSADARYHSTFRKLEVSLKKYYIVNAVQRGCPDQVLQFFERHGDSLLCSGSGDDWHSWFVVPYMKHPSADPHFQVYFSKEWLDTLIASFSNFLSEVFDSIPIRLPVLLRLHSERVKSRATRQELENVRAECAKLQTIIQAKEDEITKLKSDYTSANSKLEADGQNESKSHFIYSQPSLRTSVDKAESFQRAFLRPTEESVLQAEEGHASEPGNDVIRSPSREAKSLRTVTHMEDTARSWYREEEDIPHVVAKSQDTFSGHTSPITRCRFSTAGSNIASASVDGTVRIWPADSAASTSQNATIYCGAEIMALEWENKSDRLLLLGTAEGGVRAWNVEAKRVVCDLNTEDAFPRILELKCSPTDTLFLSVASTNPGKSTQGADALGFGSLTVWNMRTWKRMNALPLGEDPPVVTSVCFNHNGKLVAAGATDGMIRLFDMNGYLPITGWPAHDGCAVSSVRFGHNHSSIFSLGGDGKVLEWSLHNQGQILQSQDASIFCKIDGSKLPRHEMALDSSGKNLLLSSNLHSAPLFNFHDSVKTYDEVYRTLDHNDAVTSVDWHPSSAMFLTGSSDHSVRVTSV